MRTTPDPHRLRRGTVALLLAALLGLAGAPAPATPWAGAAAGVDRAEGQPTPAAELGTTSPAARRWPRALRLVAGAALLLRAVGSSRRRRDPQVPSAAARWAAAAMRGPPAPAV